ncbi:hypothetical protein [Limnohabitans sp.]|uniref:hypothetical protein n=1 Tax=Limnohabitans sp. TaxID=1907725 RepID=UPI002AFE8284|nr:hypothetical protein [Limnohabitans sp.]
MAQINRGVKFDSNSTTPVLASVASLSNASSPNLDFLAGNSGAAVWTMTPALRQAPGVVMLIEGNKLDIGIEYDSGNQVRLIAQTATSMFVSNWVAAGAEHTFGVSYQTPQTMATSTLVLSVDGNNKKEIGVNLSADSAGSVNRNILPGGNFDGLLSQVAVFNDALSDTEIKAMTGDAGYLVSALSKVAPSSTVSGVTNTPTLSAGSTTAASKINLTGTYNVGDTVSITYKGLTASYTLVAADKPTGTTDPMMRTVLTNKLAAAISTKFTIGTYTITKDTTGPHFIQFQENAATTAPQPLITFTNASNFRESALDVYANLGVSTLGYSTTTGDTLGTLKVVTGNTGDLLSFYDAAGFTSGTTPKLTPAAENGSVTAAPEVTVLQSLPTSGPFFAELSSYTPGANAGDGGVAKYQIFIDPAQDTVTPNSVKSMGLTVQLDAAAGTLSNLASLAPQSLNPITNINKVGNAATMQWFTQNATGLTDYKQAVAEVTVQLPTPPAGQQPSPSINLTFSEMSLDGKNFTSATGPVPLSTIETVQSQVFSVTGSVKQYTSDANGANGAATTFGPNSGAIKGASVVYQVYDDASKAPAKLTVQMPTQPGAKAFTTPTAPDGDLKINLSIQKPSTLTGVTGYSMVLELPSNNVAASFAPLVNATAFAAPTVKVEGRMLTISGTFAATSASDTDFALGTISLKLSNMYGKTESVGFNSVNFVTSAGNAPAAGRDVAFGVIQTDANGQYRIDNLPKGQIFPMVVDTVDKQALVGSSPLITTEDAYKVLLMAAGRKNGANDWLPSDFIAADYNRDGVVTAEDALNLLNYSVSANKAAPAMAFFGYDNNTVGMNKSSVGTPTLDNTYTYQDLTADAAQSTFDGTGRGPVMDFVGVLIGDVAH